MRHTIHKNIDLISVSLLSIAVMLLLEEICYHPNAPFYPLLSGFFLALTFLARGCKSLWNGERREWYSQPGILTSLAILFYLPGSWLSSMIYTPLTINLGTFALLFGPACFLIFAAGYAFIRNLTLQKS